MPYKRGRYDEDSESEDDNSSEASHSIRAISPPVPPPLTSTPTTAEISRQLSTLSPELVQSFLFKILQAHPDAVTTLANALNGHFDAKRRDRNTHILEFRHIAEPVIQKSNVKGYQMYQTKQMGIATRLDTSVQKATKAILGACERDVPIETWKNGFEALRDIANGLRGCELPHMTSDLEMTTSCILDAMSKMCKMLPVYRLEERRRILKRRFVDSIRQMMELVDDDEIDDAPHLLDELKRLL